MPNETEYKWTPVWLTPGTRPTETFLPYEEAMFETRTEARRWAREHATEVYSVSLMRWSNRVHKLVEGVKYPSIVLPVFSLKPQENPDTYELGLIRGPMRDEADKHMAKAKEEGVEPIEHHIVVDEKLENED